MNVKPEWLRFGTRKSNPSAWLMESKKGTLSKMTGIKVVISESHCEVNRVLGYWYCCFLVLMVKRSRTVDYIRSMDPAYTVTVLKPCISELDAHECNDEKKNPNDKRRKDENESQIYVCLFVCLFFS